MICQPDEVHVWTIPFGASKGFEVEMVAFLSNDERARASRFVPEHARRAYVTSHYALRRILSLYVDRVAFQVEARGKPRLVDSDLQFSLSHTTGLAAVGIAHSPVGIDVEAVRDIDDAETLAGRFLSEDDARDVCESDRPVLRFLEIWTTYEACAKQSGQGLAGLDKKNRLPSFSRRDKSFVDNLGMPSGFVGAIATSQPNMIIRYLSWPDDV